MYCPKCASEDIIQSSYTKTIDGVALTKLYTVECKKCNYTISGFDESELFSMFKTNKVLLSELVKEVEEYWTAPKGLPEIGTHVITHPQRYSEFYNILFGMVLVYKKFGYEIIKDIEV